MYRRWFQGRTGKDKEQKTKGESQGKQGDSHREGQESHTHLITKINTSSLIDATIPNEQDNKGKIVMVPCPSGVVREDKEPQDSREA